MQNILKYLIVFILMTNSLESEKEILEIELEEPEFPITGKIGTIVFPGNCVDNMPKKDTSKKTYFTKEIIKKDTEQNYTIDCGPWIVDNHHDICNIFCNFNESIPIGEYEISFDDKFDYLEYEIYAYSEEGFLIKKEDYDIIDLYSDINYINLLDDKQEYELKFKINVYNNEKLFLATNRIVPIDCKPKKAELICTVNRKQIENHFVKDNRIIVLSFDKHGKARSFDLIPELQINYDINKKQDIYVGITKLITKYTGRNNFIIYETNITNIQNIYTYIFDLFFSGIDGYLYCSFIKGENHPMILACLLDEEFLEDEIPEEISLKNEDEEIIEETSILYNFRIQPNRLKDKCKIIDSTYSPIFGVYPEVLNFASKDSYEIEFYLEFPDYLSGITFNEDKKDLQCSTIGNIKKCTVEKSHFKEKDSDYYYIKYDGYENQKAIAYEIQPIKVILSEDDNDDDDDKKLAIILILIGGVIVIIAIIVVIYFYFKKKKSNLEEDVMKTSFKDDE